MDGTRGYYATQNKLEKNKYDMISLMWNLRSKTDEHRGREGKINREGGKPEETLNYREQTEGYRREGVGGWGNWVMRHEEGT